jgi:Glyoxalase/Bleomycin resistance protein/Dioxygenase superfamily
MSAARRINHVSVNAKDLAASVEFYVDVFGAEPVATPNFGLKVQWLAIGESQLHLFEVDVEPLSHHHFALTVEDLEPVYRRAEARDAFDYEAFGNHLIELPATWSRPTCATRQGTSSSSTRRASAASRRRCARSSSDSRTSARSPTRTWRGGCLPSRRRPPLIAIQLQ